MNLGGIQKNSFIDYPGKISCVLFLAGCNFDCPYCHNPSLVKGPAECPPFLNGEGLYEFLKNRREFLDGVVITGGEPTVQKDLFNLCETIKGLGYPIKLDTNGSRPWDLKRLIEDSLVDYVAMDVKTDPVDYDSLSRGSCSTDDILSSIKTIMESAPEYEFRTTCVRQFVDEGIIKNIVKLIKGAHLYALQSFQKEVVLHPEFFHDDHSGYSEDEMMYLKSVADPWVERCVVR
jgi:pyruvate formate lyase activating enzyme